MMKSKVKNPSMMDYMAHNQGKLLILHGVAIGIGAAAYVGAKQTMKKMNKEMHSHLISDSMDQGMMADVFSSVKEPLHDAKDNLEKTGNIIEKHVKTAGKEIKKEWQ